MFWGGNKQKSHFYLDQHIDSLTNIIYITFIIVFCGLFRRGSVYPNLCGRRASASVRFADKTSAEYSFLFGGMFFWIWVILCLEIRREVPPPHTQASRHPKGSKWSETEAVEGVHKGNLTPRGKFCRPSVKRIFRALQKTILPLQWFHDRRWRVHSTGQAKQHASAPGGGTRAPTQPHWGGGIGRRLRTNIENPILRSSYRTVRNREPLFRQVAPRDRVPRRLFSQMEPRRVVPRRVVWRLDSSVFFNQENC